KIGNLTKELTELQGRFIFFHSGVGEFNYGVSFLFFEPNVSKNPLLVTLLLSLIIPLGRKYPVCLTFPADYLQQFFIILLQVLFLT
ncbi:hypothetical protein, partial [Streptococcus sobrinus]